MEHVTYEITLNVHDEDAPIPTESEIRQGMEYVLATDSPQVTVHSVRRM